MSPPRGDAITWVQIWSRPYQAGQLYSTEDEKNIPMRPYLIDIFETVGDVNSLSRRSSPSPFDGLFTGLPVQVDPPVPRSAAMPGAVLAGKHLEVQLPPDDQRIVRGTHSGSPRPIRTVFWWDCR